jgi:hypothetical protein
MAYKYLKESQILPNEINNIIISFILPPEKYAKKSLEYTLTFYISIDANIINSSIKRKVYYIHYLQGHYENIHIRNLRLLNNLRLCREYLYDVPDIESLGDELLEYNNIFSCNKF